MELGVSEQSVVASGSRVGSFGGHGAVELGGGVRIAVPGADLDGRDLVLDCCDGRRDRHRLAVDVLRRPHGPLRPSARGHEGDEVRHLLLGRAGVRAGGRLGGHDGSDRLADGARRGATVSGTVPVAASAADNVGVVGVQFQLDGASLGAEDLAAPYSFDWASATSANGAHTLTAVARDAAGNRTTSGPVAVTVSNGAPTNAPPVPTISTPGSTLTWSVGDVVAFSGSAVDAEDGTLSGASLQWKLIMHHCPSGCHTHDLESFSGSSGSFTAPDHEYPSHLELQLTATDSAGATGTASVLLNPLTTTLTFQTSPTGLQLAVGSASGTAPFTRTVIVGSSNSLSAISTQTQSGRIWTFGSWSDGGAQTHTITAPAAGATYTATFTDSGPAEDKALNKASSASSVDEVGHEAGKANDGSSTTRWSSSYTNNQWWQVDLGSVRSVDTVRLNWEAAYASQYQVLTSLDGVSFSVAASDGATAAGWRSTSFAARSARFVRVLGLARATQWGISFWDAQVFGPADTTVSLRPSDLPPAERRRT